MMTNWGYTIDSQSGLVDMLSVTDFNTMTANKFAGDVRIEKLIAAASMAIRNYCGWHVYPEIGCTMTERILYGNGRIKQVGPDLLIQLPATYVLGVEAVTINDEPVTDIALDGNGMIHVFDVPQLDRKSEIVITYTAGISSELMGSIAELIVSRVSRALSGTNGVSSETAGGVTISYNSSWINGGGAGALQSTDVEVLKPFKLLGVF